MDNSTPKVLKVKEMTYYRVWGHIYTKNYTIVHIHTHTKPHRHLMGEKVYP